MPKVHHAFYNKLALKLKLIAKEEATVNNSEVAVDEAINPVYFCHIVLQVCLATHGKKKVMPLIVLFFVSVRLLIAGLSLLRLSLVEKLPAQYKLASGTFYAHFLLL